MLNTKYKCAILAWGLLFHVSPIQAWDAYGNPATITAGPRISISAGSVNSEKVETSFSAVQATISGQQKAMRISDYFGAEKLGGDSVLLGASYPISNRTEIFGKFGTTNIEPNNQPSIQDSTTYSLGIKISPPTSSGIRTGIILQMENSAVDYTYQRPWLYLGEIGGTDSFLVKRENIIGQEEIRLNRVSAVIGMSRSRGVVRPYFSMVVNKLAGDINISGSGVGGLGCLPSGSGCQTVTFNTSGEITERTSVGGVLGLSFFSEEGTDMSVEWHLGSHAGLFLSAGIAL